MTDKFNFYEFAGIVIPGAVLIVGFSLLNNPDTVIEGFTAWNLSIGDLGVFLLLSFALGHILQAVGNFLENIWWKIRGGLPTTKAGMRADGVVTGGQREELLKKVKENFQIEFDHTGKPTSEKDWHFVVRRIYGKVQEAGKSERVDLFNRMYGFSRGLATAFIIIAVASFITWGRDRLWISLFLTVFALLSLYRMDRFGRHYGRELLVQYLNLKPEDKGE